MKKFIALMLSLLLALSMAACGDSAPAQPQQPAAGATAGTTAPAGTTGGTEATNGTTATTAPQKETTQATEEITEPTVEPTMPPTAAVDPYIVKQGAPYYGTADGNYYTNESIGMTCALPESMTFASEADMMAERGLAADATEEEIKASLASTEGFSVTQAASADGLNVFMVQAVKKGATDTNNAGNAEEGLAFMTENIKNSWEKAGLTDISLEAGVVGFSAGQSTCTMLTGMENGTQCYSFVMAYEVGDYIVFTVIVTYSMNNLEAIGEGCDIE